MNLSINEVFSAFTGLAIAVSVPYASAGDALPQIASGPREIVAVPAQLSSEATLLGQDATEALRLYWTPERLRQATPVPLPQREAGSADHVSKPVTNKSAPFFVAPTQPKSVNPVSGYSSGNVSVNTQGLRWDDTQSLAARVNGKLWFSDADGMRHVCSASTVASAGKSLIVTASHCVRNKKGFYSNFLYIPDFSRLNSTQSPYGEWAAQEVLSANNEGHSSGNDVAFISLKPGKDGKKIEDVTGASGLIFNISARDAEKRIFRFGYPANHDEGQELTYCYINGKYEPNFLTHYCDMTGGSSGGPVVTDFPHNALSYGHTFGVTSVGYGGTPPLTGQALFSDVEQKIYLRAGRLLPEVTVENGNIKIKNAFHDRAPAWFIYNPLSGTYSLGQHDQLKISDIITPGADKKYLNQGDVIYAYAESTSTQADYSKGEIVKSKMVEVKIK